MTREEALENLKGLLECSYVDRFEDEENEALRVAIKALEQEPKWIPISERLPEKSGYYLISTHHITGPVYRNTYVDDVSVEWFYEKFSPAVTAWMPAPEPYKVESEGKE